MSIVRSAIVWGGTTGRTCTSYGAVEYLTSGALPYIGYWTLTDDGLLTGAKVYYTAGTAPTVVGTAMAIGTAYWVKRVTAAPAASYYELYRDSALTDKILHSGASYYWDEDGQWYTPNYPGFAITLKKAEAYENETANTARYSTRIYDSLSAALTARNAAALGTDEEVIEIIAGDFYSVNATLPYITNNAQTFTLTTLIDGVRSAGFHDGVSKSGYYAYSNVELRAAMGNVTLDGFELVTNVTGINTAATGVITQTTAAYNYVCENMIVSGDGVAKHSGIVVGTTWGRFTNNIITNFDTTSGNYCYGVYNNVTGPGVLFDHNVVTKNYIGIGGSSGSTSMRCLNNVVVGNTRNWAQQRSKTTLCAGNIGDATDADAITFGAGTQLASWSDLTSAVAGAIVTLTTTGTLPAVTGITGVTQLAVDTLYVLTNASGSISLSISGSSPYFTFTDAGTGTHKINFVWRTDMTAPLHIIDDFAATPGNTFVDWANNDYRPALNTSKQVDNAYVYPELVYTDINGTVRPAYNNGGAEYVDIGPLEYDKGFGPHPVSATLTIIGLVTGSDVTILAAGTETLLHNAEDVVGTSYAYEYTTASTVDVLINKPGYYPLAVRNYTLGTTSASLPISQTLDSSYLD